MARLDELSAEGEMRARQLDAREQQLERRLTENAAREASLDAEHERIREEAATRSDNGRRRLEAREAELSQQAQELARLEHRLEEREAELSEREARVVVELELREEEVEARELAAADHEHRLKRKEEDLTRYVGQLQHRLTLAG